MPLLQRPAADVRAEKPRARKADEWRRLTPETRATYRTWMALRERELSGA